MRRVPQKRDAAEPDIVEALEAHGFSVLKIAVKDGPDLVAGKHGVTYLIEVKTGKQKLRKGQQEWHRNWRGAPVYVLRSVDDVAAFREGL